MDFTVDVDMFQNGTQNMYFKTVSDGNRQVTVLVDADGKAIWAPTLGEYTNVLFTVANNGTGIDTITDDATYSRIDIENACGGVHNVTALDAGQSVFLLVMGTHIQYCNADDTTTTPTIPGWTVVEIWADEQCTVRPTGDVSAVYAKVKETFGIDGERHWGNEPNDLIIFTPLTESPQDPYAIRWYIDFINDNIVGPITPGVYRLTSVDGARSVDGYVVNYM